jgi:hypothetical protein
MNDMIPMTAAALRVRRLNDRHGRERDHLVLVEEAVTAIKKALGPLGGEMRDDSEVVVHVGQGEPFRIEAEIRLDCHGVRDADEHDDLPF